MKRNSTLVALALIAFAGTALALFASGVTSVYSDATLTGASVRTDTVQVSNPSRDSKQDRFVIALAGTSQAAAADSQFWAVAKAIKGGRIYQIGEDSLTLKPELDAGADVAEIRVLRWVSDSLQLTTRNPMSQSVTGATLTITPTRE